MSASASRMDVEKSSEPGRESDLEVDAVGDHEPHITSLTPAPSSEGKIGTFIRTFEQRLVTYNLETRGIRRVEPHETTHPTWKGYAQAFVLWFSINLAANNITLGMLGPTTYTLSFKDASLCAVFGSLVGCMPVAFIATLGPISGNRTLIFSRYIMGWWPSKLIVLLNLIVLLGYSLIDCVVAGQILSAVSPNGNMSVVVGIIIVAVITWLISTFGIQIFHSYERYAAIPQIIVISVLYGVSTSTFDLSVPSTGDVRTIFGNRLSFFSICFSAAITYAGAGADYFVYYSPDTSRVALFTLCLAGLSTSFTFAFVIGIGLASGISSNDAYNTAFSTSQGALLVEGYASVNGFGKFCSVVVALGLIANLIPPTYSSGVDFQTLGRIPERVPRVIWNTVGVVIYTVCALAGRDSLSEIFTNFLALMGYWVAIWFAIMIEEHVLFRPKIGYDWKVWNQREKLPVGFAALFSFLVGWAGAILCMAQVWYIGPIAGLVGEFGADMGNYVGFSWAALVYPPLRWLELKRFGR